MSPAGRSPKLNTGDPATAGGPPPPARMAPCPSWCDGDFVDEDGHGNEEWFHQGVDGYIPPAPTPIPGASAHLEMTIDGVMYAKVSSFHKDSPLEGIRLEIEDLPAVAAHRHPQPGLQFLRQRQEVTSVVVRVGQHRLAQRPSSRPTASSRCPTGACAVRRAGRSTRPSSEALRRHDVRRSSSKQR